MVEHFPTSVVRSTSSGNYYNVPIATDTMFSCGLDPDMSTFEYKTVAAAWGTTTMRRLPAVVKYRNLNAALDTVAPSKDPHSFQPTFAFDLDLLVASLTKSSGNLSHSSSSTSSCSQGEPVPEPTPDNSQIPVLPGAPQQRGRRGALSGVKELAPSFPLSASTTPENSIITYSLNKRKQKRLAAKALAAAALQGPNFEVAKGNEPYVPHYVAGYQADATTMSTLRHREPSLDQQSYAL